MIYASHWPLSGTANIGYDLVHYNCKRSLIFHNYPAHPLHMINQDNTTIRPRKFMR